MDEVKSMRKTNRRLFTKACNEYSRIKSELPDEDKLLHLKLIEEKAKLMIDIEYKFRQELYKNTKDDESASETENEIDESESYIDKWRVLEFELIKLSQKQSDGSMLNEVPRNTLLNYPKIQLPIFDGNIRNWLGFWGQFKKIDNDPNLDDHDKFAYLLQSMEKRSSAEELIKSFPPGGESYKKALEQLQLRFGREDLLIEVYVRDLLSLVLQKNSQHQFSLRKLYDNLESKLRALEILGVARDKYAAMLYPLVESALPDDTLRAWQRFRAIHRKSENKTETECSHRVDLDGLLLFLLDESEGEERVSIASKCFSSNQSHKEWNKKRAGFKSQAQLVQAPTASTLVTTSKEIRNCIFCSGAHESSDCYKARKMTLEDRMSAVQRSRSCFLCLGREHVIAKCKKHVTCVVCGKRHHILLCRSAQSVGKTPKPASSENEEVKQISQDETLANFTVSTSVLLQTLTVILRGRNNKKREARAILDSASQRSYILKRTAAEMQFESVSKERLRHSLFGGTYTEVLEHDIYTIFLSKVDGSYKCNFKALAQEVICGTVPPVGIENCYQELKAKNICLTDLKNGPIEVLIGADIIGKLMTGKFRLLPSGVAAIETKLGWTVMGKTNSLKSQENSSLLVTSMLNKDLLVSDLWSLDTLGILDPSEKQSKLELQKAAREHFLKTVKLDSEGRYQVSLPWLENHLPLPDNFELANKRLESTVGRLKKENLYEAYGEVFNEWEKENIIEEVPESEISSPCHYLPHRHVVKENSTTKIRPVFDASARIKGSPSLNDCIEKGLNLIELIPSILHRFRLNKIGVIADIRKAFLQIGLSSKDKDYLRFLWYGADEQIRHYRHCRVVFGVSCSPYLLGAVIQHHLEFALKEALDGNRKFPVEIIKQLKNSFYVDNCLTSVKDELELHQFIKVAEDILAERKFELRGWEYTDASENNTASSGVLGMSWNRSNDTLSLNMHNIIVDLPGKVTKRQILSVAHKVFDPLGISCPVTLLPKLLLQRLWKHKTPWDQEVDYETREEFCKWVNDLHHLKTLEIPRYLNFDMSLENISLHFFCDASKHAYSTVAFLRIEVKNSVKVHLLQARSRIAPCGKKETTIARLELLGATIAARLASNILKEFNIKEVYFWTDSSTVLAWILREEVWDVFVHNRVQEIRQLTLKEAWRHVPGCSNPADLPSRGCSARHLVALRWWEGPDWLYLSREKWPDNDFTPNEEDISKEKKRKIISSMINTNSVNDILSTRFSSYKKIIKVMAWIKRFIYNCKFKEKVKSELTVSELKEAEKSIIRLIQTESFQGVEDKRLRALRPVIHDGIIRTKTAIFLRNDTSDFITPAILPSDHAIVRCLVMEEHLSKGHVGVSHVLNSLRERFWLLNGRRTVSTVLRSCVICKRYSSKSTSPAAPPLPTDRVQDVAVFQVTGIDFAGPLVLRNNQKAWICLFTCAVYRCVHLELVTSLSTAVFLQAFHRFVSRRGRPSTVYSDNGANFVGASNAFAAIDFREVSRTGTNQGITWKFIPPGAPWWGGWWERLVGMMKQILRRILGRACLNYEEMCSVLCNCEAILNDRPLTVVSADSSLTAITPTNFLMEMRNDLVPNLKLDNNSEFFKRRLRYIQNIRDSFRQRFRQEYLGTLQISRKKSSKYCDLKVGDVVLIGSNDKKRIDWPLGIILQLFPGTDGMIRRAKIKVKNGELTRAVQTIFPLEVSCTEEHLQIKECSQQIVKSSHKASQPLKTDTQCLNEKELPTTTRSGRTVKVPRRFDM